MQIIEQSHEILTEPDQLKLIELAGRTCYKSEDKITEDSTKGFVKMLAKAKHYAMLEFGHACFHLSDANIDYIQTSPYSKYLVTSDGLVSGNFRAWLEFFQKEDSDALSISISTIGMYLSEKYPEVFSILSDWLKIVEPVAEIDMTPAQKQIHAVRTVRFITNRGVTHELVRHRPCSFAQESTRYVQYSGDMEFIKPVWYETNDDAPNKIFRYGCETAKVTYIGLLLNGWKPQQAREVLPNALKTEIVVKATIQEWNHIFSLRCSKAAHPQMRALMLPLQAEFQTKEPELFSKPKGKICY